MIGLIVSFIIMAYLIYALLWPENFEVESCEAVKEIDGTRKFSRSFARLRDRERL